VIETHCTPESLNKRNTSGVIWLQQHGHEYRGSKLFTCSPIPSPVLPGSGSKGPLVASQERPPLR